MAIKHKHRIWEKLSTILVIAVFLIAILGNVSKVGATGTFSKIWVMENNMATSGSGQVYLAFTTQSAVTTPSLAVTFTGATTATTNANLLPATSINGVNCTTIFSYISGITDYPGTLNATAVSPTVTITTTGNFAATTAYCVILTGTSAITNPGTAGINTVNMTDTTDTGSGYYVILSAPANSFSVTATVGQIFTLSLGSNSDPIPTLSYTTVKNSTGVIATISSNAVNGVSLFAYDSHTGLLSPSTSDLIGSTNPNSSSLQTISGGATSPGYLTTVAAQAPTSGAALTVDTSFNGSAGSATATGDGLSPTPSILAYTSAPTNGAGAKLIESAVPGPISADATDYADSITVVGAGSF
jgi:hypothetical protein